MKKLILLYITLIATAFVGQAGAWPDAVSNKLYDGSGCGLTYLVKSIRVSDRETSQAHYPYPLNPTPVSFDINEFPVDSCFSIERAYIWCEISDRPPLQDVLNVTVTDPSNASTKVKATTIGVGDIVGYPNENRSVAFRADVTPYILGNGIYKIDADAEDWEISGITLFIIYKNHKANWQGHLTIYDGFLVGWNEVSQQINGINACDDATGGEVMFLASDIQKYWKYDDSDSAVTVRLDVNDSVFWAGRDFWNFNSFPFDIMKGNNDIFFKIYATASPISFDDDHITWIMNGVYYRTTTCATCPVPLPVAIQPTATVICRNDEVTLFTYIDSSNQTKWQTFEWSSDPPGFSSLQQHPVVTPQQSTRYIVRAMVGQDCRHGFDTVDIVVHDLPVVDAGADAEICTGRQAPLGISINGGAPPYNIKWTPPTGLNADNVLNVLASPDVPTTYILTVTDDNGCIGRDTASVTYASDLKPVVTAASPALICQCDSVELDAGSGYAIYKWSNGATTRKIFAKAPGDYTVYAEDANGCKGLSDPVTVNMITPTATIAIPRAQLEARNGETFKIPLYIQTSDWLDRCGYDDWTARISFNQSILAPVGTTPKGSVAGDVRYIDLEGRRPAADSVLATLEFMATLGDTDSTRIKIEGFNWSRCPDNVVTRLDTMFYESGLCQQGGTRLYFEGQPAFKLSQNSPNPFSAHTSIDCIIDEDGYCSLVITDLLGQTVATLINGDTRSGTYRITYDGSALPEGTYFYSIRTPHQMKSLMMQVVR